MPIKRTISLKIILLLLILLIPFALSGLTISQSVPINNTSCKYQITNSGNSYLVAGDFRYFSVVINNEFEKICIVAFHSKSIPEPENRSICNYYRWEYENGVWKDVSGHDSEYIDPYRCIKENNTYFFYIGIDNKAKQGHWTVLINIDNDEEIESTISIVVVTQFNFFILSLIGIFEPNPINKRWVNDIDFICSDQKKIRIESKDEIDNLVDEILSRNSNSDQDKTIDKTHDLYFAENTHSLKEESVKSTISTYSRSRLKIKYTDSSNIVIFNKKEEGGNVFWSTKIGSCTKFFAIIIAIFLLSVAFVPVIAPQNTTSSQDMIISSFSVFPDKIHLDDSIILNVTASDSVGIISVIADIAGLEKINLSFINGNVVNNTIFSGLWQKNWLVYNVDSGNYTIIVTVINKDNISISKECNFTVLSAFELNVSDNTSFENQFNGSIDKNKSANQSYEIKNSSNTSVLTELLNETIQIENETENPLDDDIILEIPINNVNKTIELNITNLKTIYSGTYKSNEIKEKRTIYSKTFLNADGLYQERIGVGPIHYTDEIGNLEDIDTSFVISDDQNYDYEVTKGFYKTKFNKKVDSENLAEYRFNESVTKIQLLDISWSDEIGEKELISQPRAIDGIVRGNRIVYPNAYDTGINIEFLYNPQYLGKYLIIDNYDSLPLQNSNDSYQYLEFSFLINISSNLDVYINEQIWDGQDIITYEKVEFIDRNTKESQFFLNKPYSEDSRGIRNPISLSLKKQDSDILISKRVDNNWLEQAVYPVKADADTIYLEGDIYDMYDEDGTNIDTDTDVQIGRSGGSHWDAYWAFPISSNIINGIINSVTFTGYVSTNDIDVNPIMYGLQWEDCPVLEGDEDPSSYTRTTNSYIWSTLNGGGTGSQTSSNIDTIFNEWINDYSHNTPPDRFGIVIDDSSAGNNREVFFYDYSHGSYSDHTYLTIDYTPPDNDPPTPDPLTWSTEPYNESSVNITMVASTASDLSLPIEYYFNETTGNSGGSDSGWQQSTTYSDIGLSENTQYGYEVKARDNSPSQNEGNYSTPVSYEYTSVDPPTNGELTFQIDTTWINATVAQPPNPTIGSTGSYFDWITGGATNSGWQSGIYYNNRTSLTENTNYGCQVRYRNADAEASTYNPTEKINYTLCDPPIDEELTFNCGVTWINATVVAPTNPNSGSTGSYFNWITGGSAISGWQNGIYYHNRTSLDENTNYGSQVSYRNADAEPTKYNPTEKTKYSLCNPPTDGEFTIDNHGINWINMSVAHPTNPTSGFTAAYFECVTGGAPDSNWITDSDSSRYYYNATGLTGGRNYGFRVKYRNGDNIDTIYTSEKQDTTDIGVVLPTVITNSSDGVEETNATLHGWLQNNGSADTTCYFLWGTSNPPTENNVSQDVIAHEAEFSYDTSGTGTLTKGTLYYYDTKANNSKGWDESGGVKAFLTKPDPLISFTATVMSITRIDLLWTDGTGGDGAYIEYFTGYPPSPWNEGDGIPIDADGNVTSPFSHTSLAPGSHYYYKAWAFATDSDWTSSGNQSAPRSDSPQTSEGVLPFLPIVITNDSTGIKETNATLKGYLQYNGTADTTCYFLWGTQNPPLDNNLTQGIIANETEFSYDTSSYGLLSEGTLYYFDTKANNTGGWDESGGVKTYLTKPNPPKSLVAQSNNSSVIYLTWNTGSGYNTTYIERNASGQTVWESGEGTMIYNGSGSNFEDTDLTEGITYYYQAWSYANWTYDSTTIYQWSDNNASANNKTNTIPTIENEVPTNDSTGVTLIPQLSITVNDLDGDSMMITWYSNSSGTWKKFGTNNTGFDGNGTYHQINNNFSNFGKTYYWYVNVSDGFNTNKSGVFHFTTEPIDTSINPITPYFIGASPFNITVNGEIGLDNITLYYRWSDDNSSWEPWTLLTFDSFEGVVFDWENYTSGGGDCLEYTGGIYAHDGSNAVEIRDNSGDASSFYHTSGIDVSAHNYECIKVDFWFYADGMGTNHNFSVDYFDGTSWQQVANYIYNIHFQNDQFYHKNVWINQSSYNFPTNMKIKFICDAANNNQHVYIDEIYVKATTQNAGGNGLNWTIWTDSSNPDINFPWNWDFNFPQSTGYYEFYSIGKKSGSRDEVSPASADAICKFDPIAPVINSYDLKNNTGSKLNNATGLLDVNHEYIFQINITDLNGWENVEFVNITAWYDNGSDSTIYNQSDNLGGNLNMFLQYDNTTETSVYKMLWPDDEAQLILGNCSETIINQTTRVINISFNPLSQIRWAGGDGAWDTTQNSVNDINSWNFNITVIDEYGKKGSKIDEYGVYKYTSITPTENWVDVVASPGFNDSSNIVTITYSSNYDFNMTIYFEENLTNTTWGTNIPIANNVDILADTDPNDDIITDITFIGDGELNAVDIFNNSGIFFKNGISNTVDVQFDVYIPLGTLGGIYTARVAIKIIQD